MRGFTRKVTKSARFRMQRRLALVSTGIAGLATALAAPIAAAQAPSSAQVEPAPAGEEEPEPAPEQTAPAPSRAAGGTPAAGTASRAGIEEIVIQGGESEAVGDFDAADSVTGFDASDLEALGVQTIEGLGKFTPNLEIVTAGSTTPTFFIRGVGLNDFNANSTGAVAIYQDDVPVNSPGLQLGTIFDLEAVNVLRGPQGTGPARNASAGAIKLYSKRPSGEYGGFLRSSFGNYAYKDFEGAIETPVLGELLSSRFAFRWSERDGYVDNRCAGAPPLGDRVTNPGGAVVDTDPRWSHCGEAVTTGTISDIPTGLPDKVNDLGNWAARGTLLFQPTLDMEWTLNAHGARRDEQSRLGVTYGTLGFQDFPPIAGGAGPEDIQGVLGGTDGGNYQKPEVVQMLNAANRCLRIKGKPAPCPQEETRAALEEAKRIVADELACCLDDDPRKADYDRVGPTRNDVWGTFLKGEIALPYGMEFTTVTGYDTYDRLIDLDLDFTPNVLFEIKTQDELWQLTQDLRLAGEIAEGVPLRWEVGGLYLMEDLTVHIDNDFGEQGNVFGVATRDYNQKLWSAAGYASLAWDFWEDFTLDGGARYNWERKRIDYQLQRSNVGAIGDRKDLQDEPWSAPTGTVRLTYRFREDTHAYWKYTRGWKGGHYNATSSLLQGVTVAEPETIDAFETGLRGSWFEGRLGLDASLFYYSYENYQIFTVQSQFGQLPEFVILNANDAEVYGSEVDLVGRPWPGAFLNVRFGWLESRFLDFTQVQQVSIIQDGVLAGVGNVEIQNTGNRLLNSPRFKLSLTAEQTLPLGRYGSLTARYDGAWTDDTFFDATEGRGIPNRDGKEFLPELTIGQPAFWLHNLRLGYRPPPGNIEIAGWVRNLTDETYKSFAFHASNFETTIYFLGEPRTYGLTVSVDF